VCVGREKQRVIVDGVFLSLPPPSLSMHIYSVCVCLSLSAKDARAHTHNTTHPSANPFSENPSSATLITTCGRKEGASLHHTRVSTVTVVQRVLIGHDSRTRHLDCPGLARVVALAVLHVVSLVFGGFVFLPFSLGPAGDCPCRH